MSAATTLLFNFPINFNTWTPGQPLPGASGGAIILTPNANRQVSVDISQIPLQMLLDAGFTVAPTIATTANRPTANLYPGLQIIDSTLNTPIWRDATNTKWISATGATV